MNWKGGAPKRVSLQGLPPQAHMGCLRGEEMLCLKLLAALQRQRGQVDDAAGSSPQHITGHVLARKWGKVLFRASAR